MPVRAAMVRHPWENRVPHPREVVDMVLPMGFLKTWFSGGLRTGPAPQRHHKLYWPQRLYGPERSLWPQNRRKLEVPVRAVMVHNLSETRVPQTFEVVDIVLPKGFEGVVLPRALGAPKPPRHHRLY